MGMSGVTAFDCRSVQPLPICDPVEGLGLVLGAASARRHHVRFERKQPGRELQPRLDSPCKSKVALERQCLLVARLGSVARPRLTAACRPEADSGDPLPGVYELTVRVATLPVRYQAGTAGPS